MNQVASPERQVATQPRGLQCNPKRVVFSGVDSDTSLTKLCQLTNEFSQIEFGVNYDLDRLGQPGFPILEAVEKIVDVLPNAVLHLSGVRTLSAFLDTVNGPELRALCRRFRRVQLTVPAQGFNDNGLMWRVLTIVNAMGLRYSLEMPDSFDVGEDSILQWKLGVPTPDNMRVLFHQERDGIWPNHGCLTEVTTHPGYLCATTKPSDMTDVISQITAACAIEKRQNVWLEFRDVVRKDNKFSAGKALEFMKILYPENLS